MATNNITALREELTQLFDDLLSKRIGTAEAKEINNTAGKIIGSCKVELEYKTLTKSEKKIQFLE